MAEPPAILVVEDEPSVRRMMKVILTEAGYSILEASDGANACSVMEAYDGQIALVISDLVMPNMGGLDFANELAIARPQIPILYISGYSDSVAVESITRHTPQSVLTKPFAPQQLINRVQELLAQPDAARSNAG